MLLIEDERNGQVSLPSESLFISPTASASLNLVWSNVTYKINGVQVSSNFPFYEKVDKTILSNCSGSAGSATLTAIVGPSGAGKSSLLQILAGRKETGVTGDINVYHDLPAKNIIKVTFMSQNDDFSPNLTVRETLQFAYKLMAHEQRKRAKSYTSATVDDILADLTLTCCADVKVSRCSGGQIKRLSIACELIAPPNIMILDEPSSGLDSNCALSVIQLLKKLAVEKNIAIIASIHQPNSKIVSIFDNLYVLSHDGHRMFAGASSALAPFLQMNNVPCPIYFNPVDIVLDIAAGQFDDKVLKSMVTASANSSGEEGNNNESSNHSKYTNSLSMKKIFDRMMTRSLPFFSHTFILFHRSLILSMREPLVFFLSLLQHISVGLVAGLVYTGNTGSYDGCYKKQFTNPLYFTSNTTDLLMMENIQTFSGVTVIVVNALFLFLATVSSTALTFPLEVKGMNNSVCCCCCCCYTRRKAVSICYLNLLLLVKYWLNVRNILSLVLLISVFMKEKTNRWYSCLSYYMGRTLADAPFRIIFPIIYSILIYTLTGQVDEMNRLFLFSLINVSFAFMAQANGIFFSSVFINSISAAAVNGCVSLTPFLLLGGFIVNIKSMPPWAAWLSNFSYFRVTYPLSLFLFHEISTFCRHLCPCPLSADCCSS